MSSPPLDVVFAPFEPADGVLTYASLEIIGGFTPTIFDENPVNPFPPTITLTSSFYLFAGVCCQVPGNLGREPGVVMGTIAVGAPEVFDLTYNLTGFVAEFEGDGALGLAYEFDTEPGEEDLTGYGGEAVLTYDYNPAPEPASLALFTTALVVLSLMQRRAGRAGSRPTTASHGMPSDNAVRKYSARHARFLWSAG